MPRTNCMVPAMTASHVALPDTTLYFWKCGEVVIVPMKGQTPGKVCKKYSKIPCMRRTWRGGWEFGKYTSLGWRPTNDFKPLKALQLILNV